MRKRHKHHGHHWGSIIVEIEGLSLLDHVFIAITLAATLVLAFPYLAVAHTVEQDQPMVFVINQPVYVNQLGQDDGERIIRDLPVAELKPEFIIHPKAEALAEYLRSKNSPMADYANDLLKQYHYRLIIGISFAESNFCQKNIRPYNCWGIGGGNPFTYQSYPHAFSEANRLIQKYHDNGMTTPETMRTTWVGWHNSSWIVAVNQVIDQLEELGL